MTATLTTIRDQVEAHLDDASNLIWSTDSLDEAIRTALVELSRVSGTDLTLSGLDGAAETTLPDQDDHVLILGAVAYALQFVAAGDIKSLPLSDDAKPQALTMLIKQRMDAFHDLLEKVRVRYLQESADHPYSQWEWDEGEDFFT